MSTARDAIALLEKHAPDAKIGVGLSAERVRELTASARPSDIQTRTRGTRHAQRYGTAKAAAANIPPEGLVVGSQSEANCIHVAAKRMGISLVTRKYNGGPERIILPALTRAELSLNSASL